MTLSSIGAAYVLPVLRAELWTLIVVVYLLGGVASWRRLLAIEAGIGGRDLLLLSALTFWGKIGRGVLILSWPTWTVLPYAVRSISGWLHGPR